MTLALFAANVFADSQADFGPSTSPQRIISLAPSITEIIFSLGLGDRLVGVTRYCDFPPAAAKITKVGGYVDPNYEAIVGLKPDLVILLTSHQDARSQLARMKVRTLTVPHNSISDIHEAIRLIGDACGKAREARALVDDLEKRTMAVALATKSKPRSKVLLCNFRDTESGQLAGMYMAGQDGFYNEIIGLAGATNVCGNQPVAFPQISAEGVMQLNPDVIIDLISHNNPGKKTLDQIKAQWGQLHSVAAVRKQQVYVIEGSHAMRPGPRYIEFLEEMARLLHPESFKEHTSDAENRSIH